MKQKHQSYLIDPVVRGLAKRSRGYAKESRVWLFAFSKKLKREQQKSVESYLLDFIARWKSHGEEVQGCFEIFFGQCIVFCAKKNTENTSISGCSIDSLTQALRAACCIAQVNLIEAGTILYLPEADLGKFISLQEAKNNLRETELDSLLKELPRYAKKSLVSFHEDTLILNFALAKLEDFLKGEFLLSLKQFRISSC